MQLEDELNATKAELDEIHETSEATHEELKAANEEMTSMNEELRSANEELEASKEELQSINEELRAVNDELQAKIDTLNTLTDDLKNLLASADIATLFLDRDFRIKRTTPAVKRLFNFIPSDVGSPLGDITWRFVDEEFFADAQRVLDHLVPVEKDVRAEDGRRYTRRILPYRPRASTRRRSSRRSASRS
jgi:two-component system CheB/CheR fusion protein